MAYHARSSLLVSSLLCCVSCINDASSRNLMMQCLVTSTASNDDLFSRMGFRHDHRSGWMSLNC